LLTLKADSLIPPWGRLLLAHFLKSKTGD
jgi:hypothetical protein